MQQRSKSSPLLAIVSLTVAWGAVACGGDDATVPRKIKPEAGAAGSPAEGGSGGSAGLLGDTCGNSKKDQGEECDDGNHLSGDGCEDDCTFTCVKGALGRGDEHCDDHVFCNGVESCGANHICAHGAPLSDGTVCGTELQCRAGLCATPPAVCGNGKLEAPAEECEDGNTVDGDGCDHCKFSCLGGDPARDCKPSALCRVSGGCDAVTHRCAAETTSQEQAMCGPNGAVCLQGACKVPGCGDGVLDAKRGEECEPPGQALCDTDCKLLCDLSGVWGGKLEIQVSWSSLGGLHGDKGTITEWVRIERTQTGATLQETVLPCGIRLPDYADNGSERYRLEVPDTIFDQHALPKGTATYKAVPRARAGSSFNTGSLALLQGVKMGNPVTDTWQANVLKDQDHDEDGHPGITLQAKGDEGFSHLVAGYLPIPSRADLVFAAMRQVLAMSGQIDNCTSLKGQLSVASIDRAVLGCLAGGVECNAGMSPDNLPFKLKVDEYVPFYSSSGGAFAQKKVTTGTSCADIRGMQFP